MRRNNLHQSAQNEDGYNRNYERTNEKIDSLFNMYSEEKNYVRF